MKTFCAIVFLSALIGLVLVGWSLSHRSIADRQLVDPELPAYVSEFVPAWGWPAHFVIDNPRAANAGSLGIEDKLLPTPFVVNWLLFSVPMALGFCIIVTLVRSFKKKNKGEPCNAADCVQPPASRSSVHNG